MDIRKIIDRIIAYLKPYLDRLSPRARMAVLAVLAVIVAAVLLWIGPAEERIEEATPTPIPPTATPYAAPRAVRGMDVPPSRAFAFIAAGDIAEAAQPGGWFENNPGIKTVVFTASWYNTESNWSFVTNGLNALPPDYKAIVRLKVSEYGTREGAGFTYDPDMPESQMLDNNKYFLVSGDAWSDCNARRPHFPNQKDAISAWMVDFADTFENDDRVLGIIVGTGTTGEAAPYKQTGSYDCSETWRNQGSDCDYCAWKTAADAAMNSWQFINNYVVPLTLDVARAWDAGTGGEDKWVMMHLSSTYSNVGIAAPWRDQLDTYRVGVWDSGLDPGGLACSRSDGDPNINRIMLQPGWSYQSSTFERAFGSQWQQHLVSGYDTPGGSELGGSSTFPNLSLPGLWMWDAIQAASTKSSGFAFWSSFSFSGYEVIDQAVVDFANDFIGTEPAGNNTVWIVFKGREPENDPWCANYLNMPYGINSDLELSARWDKVSSVPIYSGETLTNPDNADSKSLSVEFEDSSQSLGDYRYLTARRVGPGMPILLDVDDAWTPGEYVTLSIDYLSGGPGESFNVYYYTAEGEQLITVDKEGSYSWHTFEAVLDGLLLDGQIPDTSSGYLKDGATFDFRITDASNGSDVLHKFQLTSDVEPPPPTATPTTAPPQTEYTLPVIADAYMDEWNPTTNYGGALFNQIRTTGPQQPLFKVDISTIPDIGIISSATFHFYQARTPGSDQDVSAFRLLMAFDEAEVTSELASSGAPWQIANANGPSDRDTTAHGVVNLVGEGFYELDITTLVNYWRDNPGTNYGWKLETVAQDASIYHTIGAREHSTEAWQPYVLVEFLPPTPTPEPIPTDTPVPIPTPTPEPTNTPVPPPTATPVPPPTNTPVPVPTDTPVVTDTPVIPPTDTPIPPPTATPVPPPTNTPVPLPTSTPTTVAASCAGASVNINPIITGDESVYTLNSEPSLSPWRLNFVKDDGSSYCLTTLECSTLATGSSVAWKTSVLYYYVDSFYACGDGSVWDPPAPFPATCSNECGIIVEVQTPTPVPPPTDTPVPVPTDTGVPPTDTPVPVPTETPIPPPTSTPVPVPTETPIPPPTSTPVPVPTNTSVPLPTSTDVPIPTDTPELTDTPVIPPTNTPVPPPTDTPVPVPTDTEVPPPTDTPVPVPTDTEVPPPTDTPVPVPTSTPVPPPTSTPVPPTPTHTVTPGACVPVALPLCEDHELATATPVMTPPATIRPPIGNCVPRGQEPYPVCTPVPTASPDTPTPIPPGPQMDTRAMEAEIELTWWELFLAWLEDIFSD